jgi:hypothetical protein
LIWLSPSQLVVSKHDRLFKIHSWP